MLPSVELRSFEDIVGQHMDSQNYLVNYTRDSSIIEIMLLIAIVRILRNFRIILLVLLMLLCYSQPIIFLIFNSFDLVIVL